MLARAHTFTIEGLHTRHVTVEVDIRRGLPAFAIVGLADAAVREARERVQTAVLNSGYEFPARRITANLAPGDVPKAGPGLDLALACAVLAASGQLPAHRLDSHALFGELGLDGAVRPSWGALAVAQAGFEHRAVHLQHWRGEEVQRALAGPLSATARKTLGLDEVADLPAEEAVDAIIVRTRRYAAYQRKWMRRVPGLVMVDADRPPGDIADDIVTLARPRERLPRR